MSQNDLTDQDWNRIITLIDRRQCTPFLGAGMAAEILPTGEAIAQEFSRQYNYPLSAHRNNLMKVAQFVAIDVDRFEPKDKLADIIDRRGYPNFDDPLEPHGVLASLPFPLYLTTNYDHFMYRAIVARRGKAPKKFFPRWNDDIDESKPEVGSVSCSVESPAVYHFHGEKEDPASMVLTEDDYLDFLVRVSRDNMLIPPQIQRALKDTSLLFIGYSLNDMNFRVVFRALVESRNQRRLSLTVQLSPDEPGAAVFLAKYFGNGGLGLRVYWGTARQFTKSLKERWEAAHVGDAVA